MLNQKPKELKYKIKDLRYYKGWTQTDMAFEIDVSIDSIKSWESGRGKPGVRNHKKLNDLFKEASIK